MKKFIIASLIMLVMMPCSQAFAKREKSSPKGEKRANVENVAPVPMPADAVDKAEVMPRFKYGGIREFRTWIENRFKCPKSVYTDLKSLAFSQQAMLMVVFLIDIDGSAKFVETRLDPSRNGALFENAELNAELARIMAMSPVWTPAMQNGEPKRLKCVTYLKIDIW